MSEVTATATATANKHYITEFLNYWDGEIKNIEYGEAFYVIYKDYENCDDEEYNRSVEIKNNLIIGWRPSPMMYDDDNKIVLEVYIKRKNKDLYLWYKEFSCYNDYKKYLPHVPWKMCECGDLLTSVNSSIRAIKCQNCTLFSRIGEDRCCICLDNQPELWNILSCGHSIHKRCCSQIVNEKLTFYFKCPLCRSLHIHEQLKILK
jgi:hypothetical protein